MSTQHHLPTALVPHWRACHTSRGTPKKRYRTGWHARRIAFEMEQLTGEAMSAYRCPVCLRYHIGHRRDEG